MTPVWGDGIDESNWISKCHSFLFLLPVKKPWASIQVLSAQMNFTHRTAGKRMFPFGPHLCYMTGLHSVLKQWMHEWLIYHMKYIYIDKLISFPHRIVLTLHQDLVLMMWESQTVADIFLQQIPKTLILIKVWICDVSPSLYVDQLLTSIWLAALTYPFNPNGSIKDGLFEK